jgi:hypothetical protein
MLLVLLSLATGLYIYSQHPRKVAQRAVDTLRDVRTGAHPRPPGGRVGCVVLAHRAPTPDKGMAARPEAPSARPARACGSRRAGRQRGRWPRRVRPGLRVLRVVLVRAPPGLRCLRRRGGPGGGSLTLGWHRDAAGRADDLCARHDWLGPLWASRVRHCGLPRRARAPDHGPRKDLDALSGRAPWRHLFWRRARSRLLGTAGGQPPGAAGATRGAAAPARACWCRPAPTAEVTALAPRRAARWRSPARLTVAAGAALRCSSRRCAAGAGCPSRSRGAGRGPRHRRVGFARARCRHAGPRHPSPTARTEQRRPRSACCATVAPATLSAPPVPPGAAAHDWDDVLLRSIARAGTAHA